MNALWYTTVALTMFWRAVRRILVSVSDRWSEDTVQSSPRWPVVVKSDWNLEHAPFAHGGPAAGISPMVRSWQSPWNYRQDIISRYIDQIVGSYEVECNKKAAKRRPY